MPLPTLTVKLDGPTLLRGRVLLDGHEIAGLTELNVSCSCEAATVADLRIVVGELEMDAKTLAVLAATVKTPAEPEAEEPELRTFEEEPSHA